MRWGSAEGVQRTCMAISRSAQVLKMPVGPALRQMYPPAYGRSGVVTTLIRPVRGAKLRPDMLRVSSAMGDAAIGAAAGVGMADGLEI